MPKIIGTTLEDHRELTRLHLFDALGQLMSEQSFDTITMSQIASRANVGRTAVYNHFEDKETLLLAFMRQATRQFSTVLTEVLEDIDDPLDQICLYIRAHLELKDRYHLASGVNLRRQISPENTEHLHDHAGIVENILFTVLVKAIQTDRIPSQDPHLLINLIHSTLAGQPLPADPGARERTIFATQLYILRGIGIPSEEATEICARCPEYTTNDDDTPLPPAQTDPQPYMRCPVTH